MASKKKQMNIIKDFRKEKIFEIKNGTSDQKRNVALFSVLKMRGNK